MSLPTSSLGSGTCKSQFSVGHSQSGHRILTVHHAARKSVPLARARDDRTTRGRTLLCRQRHDHVSRLETPDLEARRRRPE